MNEQSPSTNPEHLKYPAEIIESQKAELIAMGVDEEDAVKWLARHIDNSDGSSDIT